MIEGKRLRHTKYWDQEFLLRDALEIGLGYFRLVYDRPGLIEYVDRMENSESPSLVYARKVLASEALTFNPDLSCVPNEIIFIAQELRRRNLRRSYSTGKYLSAEHMRNWWRIYDACVPELKIYGNDCLHLATEFERIFEPLKDWVLEFPWKKPHELQFLQITPKFRTLRAPSTIVEKSITKGLENVRTNSSGELKGPNNGD